MKEPKTHWGYGVLSGFSKCCIVWFYIRKVFLCDTGFIYTRLYELLYNAFPKSKFDHVICPFHRLLSVFKMYKPLYHQCSECGWQQFGNIRPCAIEKGHETWVTEGFEREYKNLPNTLVIRTPGRIPNQIYDKYFFKDFTSFNSALKKDIKND